MNIIKIEDTEVYLTNKEFGQGKIIISNDYGYNFSYYWGGMNDTLEDFLCRINSSYFVGCLGNGNFDKPINTKKTIKNIRKLLREDFYNNYPWYSYKELHKNISDKLKDLETEEFRNVEQFMYCIDSLVGDFCVYSCDDYDYNEAKLIESELKSLFSCEPWHLIHYDEHPKNIWLSNFHKKLIKELKKQKKLQEVK